MARPDYDELPADLSDVAVAIGRFLPESGPQLGIDEILPVWVITLAELQAGGGVANAQEQDLWHLQLRPAPNARAVAFARVKDLSRAVKVHAVYISPLAGNIDDAMDLADKRYPQDSWRTRLLDVPEAHLTLLWLTRPGKDRLIFLDDAVPGGGSWRKSDDLSNSDFRNRLQGLEPILGIEPRAEGGRKDETEAESSDS